MIVDNSELLMELKKANISFSDISKRKIIFEPFWDDFKVRFCWSSNAIEGNTLSLDDTIDVVLYDEVNTGHTYTEYTEAKNLYNAISKQISYDNVQINEEWIKKCNSFIIGTEQNYRNSDVYIGTLAGATYFPPHHTEVPKQIDELLSNIKIRNDNIENTIIDVAEFHMRFERIHPFRDGNGRTGRMILNQQLINSNLLPVTIDKTSKYRQAFRAYDRNKDISLLVHLICSNELEALKRVHDLEFKYKKDISDNPNNS